jgi:hypothetical protein
MRPKTQNLIEGYEPSCKTWAVGKREQLLALPQEEFGIKWGLSAAFSRQGVVPGRGRAMRSRSA